MSDIDVFIVTYNRKERLKRAINSVFNQTFNNYDLYILDNCSSDGTQELVKSINESRLHYVRHEKNLGGIGNINFALSHGKSDYIVIFHDDDTMHDDFLEIEKNFLDMHRECDAVSSLSNIKDERNHKYVCAKESDENCVLMKDDALIKYLYHQYNLIFPSIMYRNSSIQKFGMQLDPEVGPCADVNMYIKAMIKGATFDVINKGLMDTVIHYDQDSTANFGKMINKLFKYWHSDELLKPILDKYSDGQRKFFKWFINKEYRRVASKSITSTQARNEINELNLYLESNLFDIRTADVFLTIEQKTLPVINKLFKLYKKVM